MGEFPGTDAVDYGAAGFSGDVDDSTFVDPSSKPFEAAGDVQAEVKREECLAGLFEPHDEANLLPFKDTFDESVTAEARFHINEGNQINRSRLVFGVIGSKAAERGIVTHAAAPPGSRRMRSAIAQARGDGISSRAASASIAALISAPLQRRRASWCVSRAMARRRSASGANFFLADAMMAPIPRYRSRHRSSRWSSGSVQASSPGGRRRRCWDRGRGRCRGQPTHKARGGSLRW